MLLFCLHRHSYRNRNRIYHWLYTLWPYHMTRFKFCWFRNNILTRWRFSSLTNILTILSLSHYILVLIISTMISYRLLRNLYSLYSSLLDSSLLCPSLLSSSLLDSFLTPLLMPCNLFYHNISMAYSTQLSSTTTWIFMFFKLYLRARVLAIFTLN